jgi:hypothetical protein
MLMAFHSYNYPESLDSAVAVKEYLEYLAVKREVSASTQNQALNATTMIYTHVLNRPGLSVKSPADI